MPDGEMGVAPFPLYLSNPINTATSSSSISHVAVVASTIGPSRIIIKILHKGIILVGEHMVLGPIQERLKCLQPRFCMMYDAPP